MKNLLVLAGAVLAASLWALPASAQRVGFELTGTLSSTCTIQTPGDQTIDPSSSQSQPIGSAGFACNFVGNPTVRLWSANAGKLIAPAAATNGNVERSLPYQFIYDGTVLGQLTNSPESATPITRTSTAGASTIGAAAIQIQAPATIAGTYGDTIYFGVTP